MVEDYRNFHSQLVADIRKLRRVLPGPMGGFGELHRQAVGEQGELSVKNKELIALGIGIAIHCEGCIALHVKAALNAGASEQEILDTIGVAILMGGGPAMIYGLEASRALEQLTEGTAPHPD